MSALTGVEVKRTIGAEQIDQALATIGLTLEAASLRDVCFFEALEGPGGEATAPAWGLYRRGIQLRARYDPRNTNKGDTTVKLRPAEPVAAEPVGHAHQSGQDRLGRPRGR